MDLDYLKELLAKYRGDNTSSSVSEQSVQPSPELTNLLDTTEYPIINQSLPSTEESNMTPINIPLEQMEINQTFEPIPGTTGSPLFPPSPADFSLQSDQTIPRTEEDFLEAARTNQEGVDKLSQPIQKPQTDQFSQLQQNYDKASEEARSRESRLNLMGGLLGAGQQIGAGLAGLGSRSFIKAEPTFAKQLSEEGQKGVENVENTRKARMNELQQKVAMAQLNQRFTMEMQDQKSLHDPNSIVSQFARGLFERSRSELEKQGMNKEQFDKILNSNPSAAVFDQIRKTTGYKPSLQSVSQEMRELSLRLREQEYNLKVKGEERREEQFGYKKGETEKKRKEDYVQAFNKDKSVIASQDALKKVNTVKSMINANSKLAPGFVVRALARMAGEVGVMTEQDVEAFRGSPAWSDQMERIFISATKGTLSSSDKKEMLKAVDIMKNVEEQNLLNRADFMSEQASKASGLDKEEIKATMLPKSQNIQPSSQQDPQITKYAQEHNISYDQASKIKQQREIR